MARDVGDRHAELDALGALGALRAQRGEIDRAESLLDEAEPIARALDRPDLKHALDLHRRHVALAHIRAGADRSNPAVDALLLQSPTHGHKTRLAHRLLARAASQLKLGGPHRVLRVCVPRVNGEVRWFEGSEGRVSLANRPLFANVMGALLRLRLAQPGAAVEVDALLAAGWPHERMLRRSGIARLQMAVARLRKLGLYELLQTHEDGGYLLDPEVPVVIERG
jgi:hypothetical protein